MGKILGQTSEQNNTEKRKRGRPRINKTENAQSMPKKKRGRPKKNRNDKKIITRIKNDPMTCLKTRRINNQWTEDNLVALGEDLIEWMNADPTHIFVKEFMAINGLYEDLINDYRGKSVKFSDLFKKAKTIQEAKLLKYASANKLNSAVSIFVLKNHHGYADKQEIKHSGVSLHFDHGDDKIK